MIVECPNCSARYRVDDAVLEKEPRFRCSRCSHIFSHDVDDEAAAAGDSVFEEEGGEDEEPVEGEEPAAAGEPYETGGGEAGTGEEPELPGLGTGGRSEPSRTGPGESLAFSFDSYTRDEEAEEPDEEEETDEGPDAAEGDDDLTFEDEPVHARPSPVRRRSPDEPRFVRGEDELRVEPPDRASPTRPWVVFTAVLALVWVNLALYLRSHPAEAISALSELPVVGRPLTEDRVLRRRVHLDDLHGSYQRIKDDQLVFVVSGRARNTSTGTLRGVQIESGLYAEGGESVATKSIYCGNAMSLKMVKDLSSKEISLLQRLEPPQRFEIRPGQSAAFTVVFMNPPEGFREFSARVVAAERTVA